MGYYTYTYPQWYTKKRHDYNLKFLLKLKKYRYIHSRSSEYYGKLAYKYYKITLFLTAFSSILSFLSTSNFINSETQTAVGISVGILAAISTMLQTLANATVNDIEIEHHKINANEFTRLIEKSTFEIKMPNEECFACNLECQVSELLNKCKYTPPHFILKEWTNIKEVVYQEMCEKLKYEDMYENTDYDTNIYTPPPLNFNRVEPNIVVENNEDEKNLVETNEEENKIILNESNSLPQNTIEMV